MTLVRAAESVIPMAPKTALKNRDGM